MERGRQDNKGGPNRQERDGQERRKARGSQPTASSQKVEVGKPQSEKKNCTGEP